MSEPAHNTLGDEPSSSGSPRVAGGATRGLLVAGGCVALVLGAVGVVLPGLPTTPFVLLAAYCFARSSPRLHQWLLRNRVFGPLIRDWQEHGSIPLRAKVIAVTMIVLLGGFTLVFILNGVWPRVAVATVFVAVSTWLITRPTSTTRPPE